MGSALRSCGPGLHLIREIDLGDVCLLHGGVIFECIKGPCSTAEACHCERSSRSLRIEGIKNKAECCPHVQSELLKTGQGPLEKVQPVGGDPVILEMPRQ